MPKMIERAGTAVGVAAAGLELIRELRSAGSNGTATRGGDAERVARHEERPHEERPGEQLGGLEVPPLKLNEECLAENKLKTGVRSRHANGDCRKRG